MEVVEVVVAGGDGSVVNDFFSVTDHHMCIIKCYTCSHSQTCLQLDMSGNFVTWTGKFKCLPNWGEKSFDGWMSDIWDTRHEQPIHLTSTQPCITRAAGMQEVKITNFSFKC